LIVVIFSSKHNTPKKNKPSTLKKKEEDQVRPREPAETDNIDIDADEIKVPIRAGRGMAMDW